MTDISVKLTVQIPGGPTIQTSQTLGVEAYESYDVSLPPESTVQLTVLPADVKGKVKLFLVQSSLYSQTTGTDKITYSIDGKITDRELDAPQLFLGTGTIDDLGPPQKVTFKNAYKKSQSALDKDKKPVKDKDGKDVMEDVTKANTATITILVGKDAAATPAG